MNVLFPLRELIIHENPFTRNDLEYLPDSAKTEIVEKEYELRLLALRHMIQRYESVREDLLLKDQLDDFIFASVLDYFEMNISGPAWKPGSIPGQAKSRIARSLVTICKKLLSITEDREQAVLILKKVQNSHHPNSDRHKEIDELLENKEA